MTNSTQAASTSGSISRESEKFDSEPMVYSYDPLTDHEGRYLVDVPDVQMLSAPDDDAGLEHAA